MKYGHCRINGGLEIVEVIAPGKRTSLVRRTYKGRSIGKPIKRKNERDKLLIYPEKTIRWDLFHKEILSQRIAKGFRRLQRDIPEAVGGFNPELH